MDLVELEHRLTEVTDLANNNTKRLDDVEKRQDNLDELVSTVKVLAVREENVENDVKEIKTDVKNLANRPAKKWENMEDKVVSLIVAAIVGFILGQLGF